MGSSFRRSNHDADRTAFFASGDNLWFLMAPYFSFFPFLFNIFSPSSFFKISCKFSYHLIVSLSFFFFFLGWEESVQ